MSLVMADVWFWRTRRVIPHIFLGGIVTVLFFTLCQRGYELVNWALLGLVVVCLAVPLFKGLFVIYDTSDTEINTSSCSCISDESTCSCDTPICPARAESCKILTAPTTCDSS